MNDIRSLLSSVTLDPVARTELGLALARAIALCRQILEERPDALCLLFSCVDYPTYMLWDRWGPEPAQGTDPRFSHVRSAVLEALPQVASSDNAMTMSVQRHVASLSAVPVPEVPITAERTDVSETGMYAPIRDAIRAVGNQLADGEVAIVGAKDQLLDRLSAHQRIEMERIRKAINPKHLAALDDASFARMISVRRLGDAARLEQSFAGGHVQVNRVHVVPLPPERSESL